MSLVALLTFGATGWSANNNSNGVGRTPPSAPSDLAATSGDKQVVLTWGSVKRASTYNVYMGTSQNGESQTPVATNVGATTFTKTGLTNGVKYFFKITAVNSFGSSPLSNEASAMPVAPPAVPPAPANLGAAAGDQRVVLTWAASTGAASYNLYRGTSAGGEAAAPVKTLITGTTYTDMGLTNGVTYFYKVAAVNTAGTSGSSNEAKATPVAPPAVPPAPANLGAAAGDQRVVLTWAASTGAASYNLYRGTSAGGESATPVKTLITGTTYTDMGLTNGVTYFYKVAALNNAGTSGASNEASAAPSAPTAIPPAPAKLTAAAGNQSIVLTWAASTGAASYNLYRGTSAGGEPPTPVKTLITGPTYTDTGLTNGVMYFYKVDAVNTAGTSGKSNEASAAPSAPVAPLTPEQKEAFRFLRQSTFGPNLTLVNHVVQVGKATFLDEQFALTPTPYPDALITMPNMELVSEQFFQNAIQGQDQLRQRVAWALSQIFVTSAVKVDNTHAMVPYIRMLEQGAFGNVLDLMRNVTLSPAMGEFLDMVNNLKATSSTMPNENYAREWMQLLSIGLQELNNDGTPMLNSSGHTIPTYTQSDIANLARVLTGWTYGDANATNPTNLNPPYYEGPMKPVAIYHDTGQKVALGATFNAGQTAQQDLDQALTVIFGHHNVGPFLSRQLIQKLVTSNPSPTYINDVATVFNNNGQGVRGDLKAVVRAILLHPEAVNGTATSGKFQEPSLYLAGLSRALGAAIVDHPFLTDFSQSLSQRIWFAPSVFNYYSPNFRAGTLFAPEMQIWTTATAMTRTNFAATLLSGGFGSEVTVDYSLYLNVAGSPSALVDLVDGRIMGDVMSPEMKQAILTALAATTSNEERVQTAIYLAVTSMQYQVEH